MSRARKLLDQLRQRRRNRLAHLNARRAQVGLPPTTWVQKRIVSDYDIFDRPLIRYEGEDPLVEIDGKQINLNKLDSPFDREKEAE